MTVPTTWRSSPSRARCGGCVTIALAVMLFLDTLMAAGTVNS
jgi:hypothetical protein